MRSSVWRCAGSDQAADTARSKPRAFLAAAMAGLNPLANGPELRGTLAILKKSAEDLNTFVAKLDDRLIILVDLERLLAHELRAAGASAPGARAADAPDTVS
mgnify:CR=1 FL=1